MLELFLKIQGNIRISILDELYKTNKQKVLSFVLTSDDGSWRMKNALKISSKYLMDRTYKMKQYLNYLNWWYKSKYSSSPEDILKSAKKIMKNSTLTRQLPKLQLLNFLAKFLTETKYLMKTLTFARRKHKHL